MSDPCVFCEIVAGTSPASLVVQNDLALALLTIGPIRPGHTLVIPKRHAVEFPDAHPSEVAAILELGAEVARRQRRTLGSTGETLFLASGAAGEQSVFHLHLHVVPRHNGDGLGLTEWWQQRIDKPGREALDAIANRLRASAPA
jgi:histidine triad (HIT) family protein